MPNLMKHLAFDALDAVIAAAPYWRWCEACGYLTNHTTEQHQQAAAEGPEEPGR